MKSLQEYKIDQLNKKSQFVTFTIDGLVIDSCHTLIDLSKYKQTSFFEDFPIIENLKSKLNDMKIGDEAIVIPRIENNFNGEELFHDFKFCRLKIDNEEVLLWVIYDYTEHYKYLIKVQQERNEAIVKNEYLLVENEINKLDKSISSLKTENNFKTLVFSNINNKIIKPIVSSTHKLNQLANEHAAASDMQNKLFDVCKNISNAVYKINLNSIFAKPEEKLATIKAKSVFNLTEVLGSVSKIYQENLCPEKNGIVLFNLSNETPKQIVSDKQYIIKTLCNLLNEINSAFVKDNVEIDVLPINSSNNNLVKFCIKRKDFELDSQLIKELSDMKNTQGYVKQIDLSRVHYLLKQINGNIKCNINNEDKYLIEVEIPYALAA